MKVLFTSPSLEPADMAVSFEGAEGRAQAAYALSDQGYTNTLVISPGNKKKLEDYDRRFKPSRPFFKIPEEKARTTFENALYSSRIVKQHHFKSVILVTSWNHMPRSCLLLRMMLLGSGTQIIAYPVATGKLSRENWFRHTVGWKMVYNDIVDTWGSCIECIQYKINGEVPIIQSGKSGILSKLKQFLLFDIRTTEFALNSA